MPSQHGLKFKAWHGSVVLSGQIIPSLSSQIIPSTKRCLARSSHPTILCLGLFVQVSNHCLPLLLLLLLHPQNLLSSGGTQVSVRDFICELYQCCNPCSDKQEVGCVDPLAGPELVFRPTAASCPIPPPPVNVGSEVRVCACRSLQTPFAALIVTHGPSLNLCGC
jgi:hypothetical protein